MATERRIIWRLQPEGGAELVSTIKRGEEAGVQAATAIAGATERATAAAERNEAQWRRSAEAIRAAGSATPLQSQIDRTVGVTGGGNARADVAARTLFAADDAAIARAAQLRAEIDPLWAAQARYNRELADFAALQKRGAISTMEMAQAQALAKTRLDATTAALAQNTNGLTRNQVASRLNLARQGADVAVTAAMGMNPAMIAIQQGPQIADALATSGIRASAGMLALGAGLTVAAGAAAVAAASWKDGESQALVLDRAVTGLGRTSGLTAIELETLAQSAAIQGEVSVRSARAQAASYVQTGRIGGEVIGGLIAIGKDYAAVMGLDAEEATQSLAKAMAEPDKAARELTRQMGLLDQKTLDHIDTLVKHGDRLAAQKLLLEALTGAVDGQAERIGEIESAWDAASRAVSNYFDELGRALYTTSDEKTAQQIRTLEERLAVTPETARRDLFRLDRQQRNPLTPAERQRAELELEGLRGLRNDEAADRMEAAAIARRNEAAQRAADLQNGRRTARGSGPDRSGERDAREAETRRRAAEDRAAMLELEMTRALGDVDHVRVLEDEAAVRERIRQLVDDDVEAGEARNIADREQAILSAARAETALTALTAHGKALELQAAQLMGDHATAEALEEEERYRASIAAYQAMSLDLTMSTLLADTESWAVAQQKEELMARAVEAARDEHQLTLARLAGREAEVIVMERAARIASRAREIERDQKLNRGEGEDQARTEIGQEDAAKAEGAFRSSVKGFIAAIRQGGIRDALANQFDQATDRLIDNLVDKLFEIDWAAIFNQGGGGAGGGGDWVSSLISAFVGGKGPGRNAAGTDYWSGGWTWVGEEGPELIRAPRGAQIASNGRSLAMMGAAAGGGGPPAVVNNYFSGNLMTPEFWAMIQRGDVQAAGVGAARGANSAVSTVRATAPSVQRVDRMMRG